VIFTETGEQVPLAKATNNLAAARGAST